MTRTECKKKVSFRTEEECGTKPDKECRVKTKIVQVPEEQIKLVSFPPFLFKTFCHFQMISHHIDRPDLGERVQRCAGDRVQVAQSLEASCSEYN